MNSLTDPPHGYDYGMKSGHCLIKNDEQLKSIESEFDAKGRVQGFVKIDYFNKTRVYGHCVDGVLHGITRWAILIIFKFHFFIDFVLAKVLCKKVFKNISCSILYLEILPQNFKLPRINDFTIFYVLN